MAKRKRKPATQAELEDQLRHLDLAARPPGIMTVTSTCDSYLVQDHVVVAHETKAAADLIRRQLRRGAGRGGVELPPEAHRAIPELERIHAQELTKPRAERRTMEEIVVDYWSGMTTLVTPAQLLKLWKHAREKAAKEHQKAASEKP